MKGGLGLRRKIINGDRYLSFLKLTVGVILDPRQVTPLNTYPKQYVSNHARGCLLIA